MKILLYISLLISMDCCAQKMHSHADTIYCVVGYNCTESNGETRDGSCGLKSFTKLLTVKEVENSVKHMFPDLKRVVILALTFMTKDQYYIYWSESNNNMNGKL